MSLRYEQTLLRPHERVLSTLEADGSRRWLTPKLSRGRFWTWRRWVAYGLIALFAGLPYVTINAKPAVLLDLAAREFTLFGYTFLPTDTALLALFLVAVILGIFFVTALLGRVWCGWGCPQTVYMEFVYRPIERLCLGRSGKGGKPAADVPAWRYGLMYLAFVLVSLLLANVFLSYFVGVDQLRLWVTRSPIEHPASFMVMLVTAGLILFDFGVFREQTCTIACPYGRIQSVLTDRQSLVISYDPNRGEPRGKMNRMKDEGGRMKTEAGVSLSSFILQPSSLSKQGDCVDCDMCVSVCPTGIDIRDGLQLECIGCAQCIDACDTVMSKIGRPLGLIRYTSQAALAGERTKILRPRVAVYSLILVALLSLLGWFLATKSSADVTLLRSLGSPFIMNDAGLVENPMRVKITNRSDSPITVRFSVVGHEKVRVETQRAEVTLGPGEVVTEPVRMIAPQGMFKLGAADVNLRVSDEAAGVTVDTKCRLLGPIGAIP